MGCRRSRRGWLGCATLASSALTPAAQAHMALPGAGDVLSGVAHPYLTLQHLLVLLALGLLTGQRLAAYFQPVFTVFPIAVAVALALTTQHWIAVVPVSVFVALAFGVGGFVALDRSLPPWLVGVMAGAAAVAIGLDSGLESTTTMSVGKVLLGTWIGLCAGLANLAYYTSVAATHGKQWLSIAVRVVGSWLVAISLLMLAFALRKQG